jgi:hypothetical protein
MLKRRLGPLNAQGVDAAIAHAELRRWIESDGPTRMKRVRLTDVVRAALGLRATQRCSHRSLTRSRSSSCRRRS